MKKTIIAMFTAITLHGHASTINVADFGAVANDGKDDARAVKAALKACKQQGASTLVFPKGQYDFYPAFMEERYCFISNNDEGLKRIAFLLLEMENLTIDGQESAFMFHGFINPFIVENSKNIRFKNFSIDFSRPFHSKGIILGYDEEGMDIAIPESFPFEVRRGILHFTDGLKAKRGEITTLSKGQVYGVSSMLEYNPEKRETAYMVKDYYFNDINGYPAEQLGGRKVRIKIPGLKGTVGNAMSFAPNHRNYPGFALSDCRDIIFNQITIHHAGGMGIVAQRTHNVTVDHCKVTPSNGRIISATADATHFVNCTGKITLTNNLFEGQKDDATNIHGNYVQVIEKTGGNEIIVQLKHHQQFGFDFLKPGTEVEFVHSKSLITYATASVKNAERINNEFTKVSFTSPLPSELKIGDALAELTAPEVLIADNIIRNNRARGIVLKSRGKTVVENNYFHTPGSAILFMADAQFWFEQGGVRDCLIRNNIFENCNFGVWGNAVIDIRAKISEDEETSRYNRNIRIENNTFRMFFDGKLLYARYVDGLIWRNNKVEKTDAYPPRKEADKRYDIGYSENVKIEE